MTREGRSSSSLVTEAVVIVGSILLAFAIDAAWDGVQERRARQESLSALLEEVRLNLEELEEVASRNGDSMSQIDRFFRANPDQLLQVPQDSARAIIRSLILVPEFTSVNEAATAYTTLPAGRESDEATKRAVGQWLRRAEGLLAELETARDRAMEVDRLIAEHAAANRAAGLSYLPSMVMRSGPGALVRIWSDDDLASSLIAKGTAQRVYGLVLEFALEDLRALEVVLEASLGGESAL